MKTPNFFIAELYAFGSPQDIIHWTADTIKTTKSPEEIVDTAKRDPRFYSEQPFIIGVYRPIIHNLKREEFESTPTIYHMAPSERAHPLLAQIGYNPKYTNKEEVEFFLELSKRFGDSSDNQRIEISPYIDLINSTGEVRESIMKLESAMTNGDSEGTLHSLERLKKAGGLTRPQQELYELMRRKYNNQIY